MGVPRRLRELATRPNIFTFLLLSSSPTTKVGLPKSSYNGREVQTKPVVTILHRNGALFFFGETMVQLRWRECWREPGAILC